MNRVAIDALAVAGVIVGVMLGLAECRDDNARVFGFSLEQEELNRIESVLSR